MPFILIFILEYDFRCMFAFLMYSTVLFVCPLGLNRWLQHLFLICIHAWKSWIFFKLVSIYCSFGTQRLVKGSWNDAECPFSHHLDQCLAHTVCLGTVYEESICSILCIEMQACCISLVLEATAISLTVQSKIIHTSHCAVTSFCSVRFVTIPAYE